jgi:stearoyl-CoA desaturase (Delta-9 desaturase)
MTELILVLIMTHLTILSVTIFLHRSQAHRSVELHPVSMRLGSN